MRKSGNVKYIIGDVGSNWNNLQDCLDSITALKQCGATHAKFQHYTHKELYGTEGKLDRELPKDWLLYLKERCDLVGIKFLCSAFSVEGIDRVDPFVEMHKVASAEITHIPMLRRLAEIGKPVLLSTGAATYDQIRKALSILKSNKIYLLYCVAAYPACGINFDRMNTLKQFGHEVGFSDHSLEYIEIPRAAARNGAIVIEKHFKLTEYMKTTPDAAHSLAPEQFKAMCGALSKKRDAFPDEEKDMTDFYQRRFILELDGYYRLKKTL